MHDHSVAGASPMRGNLLGPLERSIQGMRPADGIVRESIWASPVIYMIHHLGSSADNTIQSHHLIVRPVRSAFSARSVITYNVNEQAVIELPHVAQGVTQSSDFI